MKKLLLISILCAITATSFAQFKFKGIGGGLSLGSASAINSSGESSMGVGIDISALAQIVEKVDAEAALIFYFPSTQDPITFQMTTLNLNGHYNFYEQDKFTAYGLAGLNLTFGSTEFEGYSEEYNYGGMTMSIDVPSSSDSFSEVGLNIGAGCAYAFSDKLDGIGQLGYTLGDADQLFINFGVMYKF